MLDKQQDFVLALSAQRLKYLQRELKKKKYIILRKVHFTDTILSLIL